MELRQQPLGLRHTSVAMPYNTSKPTRHHDGAWSPVGLTMFASQIVLWLPLLGMHTGFLTTGLALTLVAGAWGILMLFNLITLPVEFDASVRARLAPRGRAYPDGRRRHRRRASTTGGSLDLCCRIHHLSRLLPLALIASPGWPQPITDAPGENITGRSTYI
jgi:hypothetical protein